MIAPIDPRKDPMLAAEKKPTVELKRVKELVNQFAIGNITYQELWEMLEIQAGSDTASIPVPLRNRITGFDTDRCSSSLR